jgi:RND family efflux transporter MFP subunit
VKTARVAEMPMGKSVVANGTLAAYDQATIGTKVPGRLQSISVDLGSPVRRGQMIGRVEPTDYQLRVQQAEAALAQARARVGLSPDGTDDRVNPEQTGTVRQARAVMEEARAARQRAVTLVEQGVIARAEFESANAAYKVAESRYQDAIEEVRNRQAIVSQRRSELALARQQLADTAIYASFDGTVQEKRASVGEYLAAGAPLIVVVKMNPLRFRAEVAERDAASVRAGQNIRVSVEGAPQNYSGRVTRLSPTIIEQNRVLVIEADISNDGALRPGSFARADIFVDDTSMGVTVPTSAIVTFAGIEKVIVVQNGKAVEKPVTTGRKAADWTEIISGVNVGEEVVTDPGNLQSGQPIVVTQ